MRMVKFLYFSLAKTLIKLSHHLGNLTKLAMECWQLVEIKLGLNENRKDVIHSFDRRETETTFFGRKQTLGTFYFLKKP